MPQTTIFCPWYIGGVFCKGLRDKMSQAKKNRRHPDGCRPFVFPNITDVGNLTGSREEVLLGRRKKLVNNTNIPQYKIEAIARCILPDILAFYESEEGQQEFAEWKVQQQKTGK